MSDGTSIQWSEATWNFVTGCTKVSDGCLKCYIPTTPPFRMAGRRFDKPGIGGTTGVILHEDRLTVPLRWRKPRKVFVNSLADLFHDQVPADLIARAFAVMSLTPQHTYQILTKRPARMRSLLTNGDFLPVVDDHREQLSPGCGDFTWPLPQVWLGVSTEDQRTADLRIPALLRTPAAVRFLSCEPLLGPVDLARFLTGDCPKCGSDITEPACGLTHADMSVDPSAAGITWTIIGGESGFGARPMHPDWARDIVRQCQDAGVAPFVKQLGSVWASDWSTGGRTVSAHGDRKGGDPQYWPADLRVREFPNVAATDGADQGLTSTGVA